MQGRHRGPGQQPPGWPRAPGGKEGLVAWAEVQRVSFSHIRTCNPVASLYAPSSCSGSSPFVQLPQVSLGWSQAQLRTCRGAGPQGPPQQYTVS